MDIYTNLFDQEVVIGRHIRSENRKAEARGIVIGRIQTYNEMGLPAEEIAKRTGQTVEFVEEAIDKAKDNK